MGDEHVDGGVERIDAVREEGLLGKQRIYMYRNLDSFSSLTELLMILGGSFHRLGEGEIITCTYVTLG